MQGCIQRALFGDVNAATVRVLAAEGFEVHAPRRPRCCGALQLHSGFEPPALELARATIAAYEDFDTIAVNVAGCGSAMKDYGHLLADDPAWADRAAAFSAKVRDVHELLAAHPAQAPRHPIAAHRRLPRRLPPGPRPADPRAAARPAAGHPRPDPGRPARVGAVLRVGRHLQPDPARGRGRRWAGARWPTCSAPAPR